jgi:hypothetical protein
MKSTTATYDTTYKTIFGERNCTRPLFRAWRSKYDRHIGKKQLSKKAKQP